MKPPLTDTQRLLRELRWQSHLEMAGVFLGAFFMGWLATRIPSLRKIPATWPVVAGGSIVAYFAITSYREKKRAPADDGEWVPIQEFLRLADATIAPNENTSAEIATWIARLLADPATKGIFALVQEGEPHLSGELIVIRNSDASPIAAEPRFHAIVSRRSPRSIPHRLRPPTDTPVTFFRMVWD